MGEVLSQSEIDSLLNALSNGELDADDIKDNKEKPVKNYDLQGLRSFPRIISERWRLYLSTMGVCYPQIFRDI